MKYLLKHAHTLILLFSSTILLAASAFVGYKSAKIDMIFSDALSDNNFLQAPFILNDIHIQEIHTHILKWPVMMLENWVGFTTTTHIVVSILLLIAMNAWLGWYFYKVSKRNKLVTSLGLILLASVEIFAGINANEGTLTMLTIRNIEIPLSIWILYASLKQKKFVTPLSVLVVVLLAILFVTDKLTLYVTIIGLALYFGYSLIKLARKKQLSYKNFPYKPLYTNIAAAAMLSVLLVKGFAVFGIAHFFKAKDENLSFIGSFNDFTTNLGAYIGKIFDVFGAGFFGKPIFDGPFFLINIALLLVTLLLSVKFFRMKNTKTDESTELIRLLFFMFVFAMTIFTLFIPRELGGRYFAYLPIIGILLICYFYRGFTITFTKKSFLLALVICIAIGAIMVGEVRAANRLLYQPKYASITTQISDPGKVSDLLIQNNVGAYFDNAYMRFEIVKQQFDEKSDKNLATTWIYCGSNVVNKHFMRKSWQIADGSKVAIRIKDCTGDQTRSVFGDPNQVIDLQDDGTDQLYIYDRDIREKLNLVEFEPGFLK